MLACSMHISLLICRKIHNELSELSPTRSVKLLIVRPGSSAGRGVQALRKRGRPFLPQRERQGNRDRERAGIA